jgi:hypothetical protein
MSVAELRVDGARESLVEDFGAFITKAASFCEVGATPSLIEEFATFASRAAAIVQHPALGTTTISRTFQQFVDGAMPLIFSDIKRLLPQIVQRANLIEPWLVRDDLLAVAGCRFVEDAYTELMAWALKPATHPASAGQRQSAWLAALGLGQTVCADEVCEPRTQVHTEDGIPDLVMQFPHVTIGVEAKTGSAEHRTPSGKKQTVAYADSLRQALNLRPEDRLKMVLITPDGRDASNDDAVCTTYVEFVLAIASALHGCEVPTDTRAAYAMLFTHFLACATPPKSDVPGSIRQIIHWSTEPDWDEHAKLNQRRQELLKAIKFLKPERKP